MKLATGALLAALALPVSAAPIGYTTVDEAGWLQCHNCLMDGITGRNIHDTAYTKPLGDDVNYYEFWTWITWSGTAIYPDPGLPANPPVFPPDFTPPPPLRPVPVPGAGLLFGLALLGMAVVGRARRT